MQASEQQATGSVLFHLLSSYKDSGLVQQPRESSSLEAKQSTGEASSLLWPPGKSRYPRSRPEPRDSLWPLGWLQVLVLTPWILTHLWGTWLQTSLPGVHSPLLHLSISCIFLLCCMEMGSPGSETLASQSLPSTIPDSLLDVGLPSALLTFAEWLEWKVQKNHRIPVVR